MNLLLSTDTINTIKCNCREMQRPKTKTELVQLLHLKSKEIEQYKREQEIVMALERVQEKAMAMHSSKDIPNAVAVVFNELTQLGIELERCGIAIFNESSIMESWSTSLSQDDKKVVKVVNGKINANIHPMLQNSYWAWKERRDFFSFELKGEQVREYYELLEKEPEYHFPKIEKYPKRQILNSFNFAEGGIFVYSRKIIPKETKRIIHRFSNVFSYTYKRYLDIIKAEERTREAIIQASINRIRAEISSMRTQEDIEKITPLIFNELSNLGVKFIRCGVFIIHEKEEMIESYLSTSFGNSLGLLKVSYHNSNATYQLVEAWRKGDIYSLHLERKELRQWIEQLVKHDQIQDTKTYLESVAFLDCLHLHFFPFLKGMLYVGNTEPLGKSEINLVKAIANSFSVAYARYEDFVKLERAMRELESAKSELEATQSQLIQSEKMASLGELTAGIAHEIQNPLNFVNNFSVINKELVEELKDEVDKGNFTEVKFIADNLAVNEEKIAHHGKRADAIVKGMLQHSRSSSGQKEPTDINALSDEYLRLAYHGLKAKDKSFNANLKTDFDENIGMISIIPQDIGRVLLNLINNALYAVHEKSRSNTSGYEPTVSVTTRKLDDAITITVSDNGNGIPESIKEKIFQPFFTTKPTGTGTGLGLSLAYDIVKAHGGELTLEMKDGGTCFIIQLPVN